MKTINKLMTALLLLMSIQGFAQCPLYDTIVYSNNLSGQLTFTTNTSPMAQPGYWWRVIQGSAVTDYPGNTLTFHETPGLSYTVISYIMDSSTNCHTTDTFTMTCYAIDTILYTPSGPPDTYVFTDIGSSYPWLHWYYGDVTGNYSADRDGIDSIILTISSGPGFNYVAVYNMGCNTRDTVLFNIIPPAGPDQTVCEYRSARMAGTGTGNWVALSSNPGPSIIALSSSPTTPIGGFTVPGVYGFVWNSTSSDTMYVTVLPSPPAPTLALTGSCIGNAILAEHGVPAGDSLLWTVDFTPVYRSSSADSFYVPAAVGYYRVHDIGTNGCISYGSDSIPLGICVTPAGPDQAICLYSSAGMHAHGSGTWIIPASNPAPAMVGSFTDSNTYISGFTVVGDYLFIWSSSAGNDTVIVSVKSNPTISFSNVIQSTFANATATVSDASSHHSPGGGNIGYWSNYVYFQLNDTTFQLHILNSGVYTFIATDTFGCSATAFDTLDIPLCHLTASLIEYSNDPTVDTFQAQIYNATGAIHYSWTSNPSSSNAPIYISSPPGPICLEATDSLGCNIHICDSVSHSAGFVWPGDADDNHLVDNTDLLPIGLGYGNTGPVRVYDSNIWQADAAADWSSSYTTTYGSSVNYKHADCDGNGIINADDTMAIIQNFGLFHSKMNGYHGTWRSGIPGITIEYSKDTVEAGDTLTATLYLGDSTLQATNLYGLAFTYSYDPTVIDTATVSFDLNYPWFGNSTNAISIHKEFLTAGTIKAAITGIDHTGRSGHGMIARMRSIITTDNINGKDLSYYRNSSYISDITAIDAQGNTITLNAGIDSNEVGYVATGIKEPTAISHLSIYPNPASRSVQVTSDAAMTDIRIIDIVGNEVYDRHTDSKRSQSLDVSGLAPGVYAIHVLTTSGNGVARLVISR